MLDEPVRGALPQPALFSLPGLEVLRAYMRGHVVATPLQRFLGARVTQVSSGTAVVHQAISPWFEMNDGFVDLTPFAEYALLVTAMTGAPPATQLRTANVSIRFLRPCTLESDMVIARGRIVHAGSSFTTVEALFEDSLGRAIATTSGCVTVAPMQPTPPALSYPLRPVAEPTYASPDPRSRPLPPNQSLSGQLPPFGSLIGAEQTSVGVGSGSVSMRASEWFCLLRNEISVGIISLLGNLATRRAISEVLDPDERFVVPHLAVTSLASTAPDGRRLTAIGMVRHRRADVLSCGAEVINEDGEAVAVLDGLCLVRGRSSVTRHRVSERQLLTVLFTDVVGSTEQVQKLGDAAWGAKLEEHNTILRQHVEIHQGRVVKTTGDGVLATFASPTRAARCARSLRDAVERLGLQLRAGIHTGECEIIDTDVVGLAVHVASRVQGAAAPGQVLASSTVRDLLAGSDIRLVEQGTHNLKGLDGSWTLFAIAED